jgi:hypothetical protein
MATDKPTLSPVLVQSHALAAVRAWVVLKTACGHSRPFFGDGPASLPVEPRAPICPVLTGAEVAL